MERMRRTWENPTIEAQQFVPSEYCNPCLIYKMELSCHIGKEEHPDNYYTGTWPGDVVDHGSNRVNDGHRFTHCGLNYITVKVQNGEVTYSGSESIQNEGNTINVTDVTDITPPYPWGSQVGNVNIPISFAKWKSAIGSYVFNHMGDGRVILIQEEIPGHPNHS